MTNIMIVTLFLNGAIAGVVPRTLIPDVETTFVDIPQNNCGYSNVNFDTSLNTFQLNDTIWFYYGSDTSNCAEPNGVPCDGSMYMTGNYGNYFGYLPYTVWYEFSNFGRKNDDIYWVVTLRYNYNGGQTSIADVIPCDGYEYATQLTRCMFDEKIYNFEFFKYYQFFFYTTCTYDFDTQLINFNLDQESRTCTNTNGNVNTNRFNQANFNDWSPVSFTLRSDEDEFCPDCSPTTTVEPTATTTEPVPTEKPCRSCGDIIINVNVNGDVAS
jgi:hypothetical protein